MTLDISNANHFYFIMIVMCYTGRGNIAEDCAFTKAAQRRITASGTVFQHLVKEVMA
jgi:hypothetical protein